MPATNYTLPTKTPYRLVRIRGVQAQILEPAVLDRILSILERDEEQDLWDALYRSQPFHSMQSDPSGAHWREGRFFITDPGQLRRAFPMAAGTNHL